MLFNSIEFLLFLPIVFAVYWFVLGDSIKWQNGWLLLASYVFYGWWDWRFLGLIILSSFIDFSIGKRLDQTKAVKTRKALLFTSLAFNLGMLGFFKYYNFFVDSFVSAFASIGIGLSAFSLSIILPVGISFYTFQTLSYTIDVYRKQLKASNDPVAFFAFVSFFPQLVAGPIERASNLLPQFERERTFNYTKATDGLKQALWGMFKKVVIADNCAIYVNDVFANYESLPAGTLVLGVVLFAFQIYCDFSGYSDIAIGIARTLGFDLMRNFAYPYFARDIAEFWRRWHISLSTWFRDYLYIPLGGSRVDSQYKLVRNVMIIFLVSGFWHGANWTFLIWGGLNGLYFLPLLLRQKNRRHLEMIDPNRWLPTGRELLGMGTTFFLICLSWVFFRAADVSEAFAYLHNIVDNEAGWLARPRYSVAIPFVLGLLAIEWLQRSHPHPLVLNRLRRPLRWSIYYTLIFCILYFQPKEEIDFIYFQF